MGLSLVSPSETIQHLTFESSHSQWIEDRLVEERSDPGNQMCINCLSGMQSSYLEKVTHNEIFNGETFRSRHEDDLCANTRLLALTKVLSCPDCLDTKHNSKLKGVFKITQCFLNKT